MPVRKFLLAVFAILAMLTLATIILIPKNIGKDKIQLVWTTDPNPQREPQVLLFNRLYPQDHLSIDSDNSDAMKVLVQSSAGMGPDIIGHVGEYSIQKYKDAGLLWDVTDQAKKMGFSPDTLPESIRPFVMMWTLDKKGELVKRQFAYPCSFSHQFIFYNKNIFDKRKISYPPEDLTWKEYINVAEKLTVYTGKIDNVPSIFGGAGVDPITLIWEKGGDILNKDGTRCLLDSKAATDAMEFLHNLYYKYKIEPTPTQRVGVSSQGGWGIGNITWFAEGKISMLWGARWALIQLRRFIIEQHAVKKKWIKEHPKAKKYEGPEVLRIGACFVPRFGGKERHTRYSVRCAGINPNSKNRKEALNFLQFLASKEYSRTINKGADGKPANKKYNNIEDFTNKYWPEEKQVHEISLKATLHGKMLSRSMFVSYSQIMQNLKLVTDKIVSNPGLTRKDIAKILSQANRNINLEIARNIKRNPKQMTIYKKLLELGAQPIALDLNKVK